MMKRILLGTVLTLTVLVTGAFAQNSAEIGAFFNYTRLTNANNTNFYGAGGRIGFNLAKSVQFEAEGAYDFERNVTVRLGPSSSSTFATSTTSGLRMVHFMAGPKFQVGGPLRIFVTVKGGLINFSSNRNFANQVGNIPNGNTDAVLYPAGGVELFAGWLGARFEVGDEIYFDHGGNNNLRITAGPTIRF